MSARPLSSVLVVCEESPHFDATTGRGKRAKVQTFHKVTPADEWQATPATTRADRARRQEWEREHADLLATPADPDDIGDWFARLRPEGTGPAAGQHLAGNEPAERVSMADALADGSQMRERFSLRCPLCGYTVPVRAERLRPILDQLAAARVSPVTLTGLAPRLS